MVMRISWSQLRTHEECKQRGFLQRTGHKSVLDNQRVFFPGTVTDRVVRDWLQLIRITTLPHSLHVDVFATS